MDSRINTLALVSFFVGAMPCAASAQDGELNVTEIQLATELENGRATNPATSFSRSDGRIYAVIRLQNPTREATSIRVAFEPVDGGTRPGVSLDIPASRRYRTVARTGTRRSAGRYRCVVRTADGRELSSVEFTLNE